MCQALGLNPDETVWTLKELTDHWQIQKVRSSATEGNIGQDGGRKEQLTSSRVGFALGTLVVRTCQGEKSVQRPGAI